jgi:hypothetical protein
MSAVELRITAPLGADDLRRYAELADVLIPASDGMPSATEADVPARWLPAALRLRPDLREVLDVVLRVARDHGAPEEALRQVAVEFPDAFEALGILTAGAYYMDPRVRELMGYPGQEARRVTDDTDSYLHLLERVVDRGPVYRPTPTT